MAKKKAVMPSLQESAERRAKIVAFLKATPGQNVKVIAEHLGVPVVTAQYMLHSMVKHGLLRHAGKEGLAHLYAAGKAVSETRPQTSHHKRVIHSKEVELVMAGMLIIIGRGSTGRLRITLEEAT